MTKIDTIRVLYSELFAVQFLHPAFQATQGSAIFDVLNVEPDADTTQLFNAYGIQYRCINDRLVCFIRSDFASPPAKNPKKSYAVITEELKLRFLVNATTRFLQSTIITAAGSKVVYHFTNTTNHVSDGKQLINRPAETHDIARSYFEGAIVNHSGQQYASLKPVDPAAAIQINNIQFWKSIGTPAAVVNHADLQNMATVNPSATCLAVIEITTADTGSAGYNVFGPGALLLSPVYTIQFKSKI